MKTNEKCHYNKKNIEFTTNGPKKLLVIDVIRFLKIILTKTTFIHFQINF